MTTSRFAHYLMAIMRDQAGRFMGREDCEQFLSRWMLNYVTTDAAASRLVKARRPLREAV